MSIPYLPNTTTLRESHERRMARTRPFAPYVLGNPGDPLRSALPEANHFGGQFNFGSALIQDRQARRDEPVYPEPKGRKPLLPPQQAKQPEQGFGLSDMMSMSKGLQSLSSPGGPTGNPINFGQFGELGADINTTGIGAFEYPAASYGIEGGELAGAQMGGELLADAGMAEGVAAGSSSMFAAAGPWAAAVMGVDMIGQKAGWWKGPLFGLIQPGTQESALTDNKLQGALEAKTGADAALELTGINSWRRLFDFS